MKSARGSYQILLFAVFLALGVFISPKASAAIKVSCIGASNFAGDGSSTGHHVPDELGRALGANYAVENLGVSGTVILFQGDLPYWNGQPGYLPHLQPALNSAPDIALFWFGGNDAKAVNWTTHADEFIPNYEETLSLFQAMPSKPKIFIFKSMVIHDVEGIPKTVLEMEVLPKIDTISHDTGAIVVPYHDAFINHPEYFPDGVHPNNAGTLAIGQWLANFIVTSLNSPPAPDGGATGTAGTTGAAGEGAAGSSGASGSAGSGTAGSTGTGGSTGASGSNGASGSSGAGTAGSTGASGDSGSGTAGSPGSGTAGSSVGPGATPTTGNAGCTLGAGAVGSTSAGALSLVLAALFVASARRRRR
jgi:hypothetical protein